MDDLTLESLAKRVAALEARLAGGGKPEKDWRDAVGTFTDGESYERLVAEGAAIREAEREAARHEEAAS